jgi:hypothetical protein
MEQEPHQQYFTHNHKPVPCVCRTKTDWKIDSNIHGVLKIPGTGTVQFVLNVNLSLSTNDPKNV